MSPPMFEMQKNVKLNEFGKKLWLRERYQQKFWNLPQFFDKLRFDNEKHVKKYDFTVLWLFFVSFGQTMHDREILRI